MVVIFIFLFALFLALLSAFVGGEKGLLHLCQLKHFLKNKIFISFLFLPFCVFFPRLCFAFASLSLGKKTQYIASPHSVAMLPRSSALFQWIGSASARKDSRNARQKLVCRTLDAVGRASCPPSCSRASCPRSLWAGLPPRGLGCPPSLRPSVTLSVRTCGAGARSSPPCPPSRQEEKIRKNSLKRA